MRSVDGKLDSLSKSLSTYVDKPLKSVMHSQSDTRPSQLQGTATP